MDPQAQFCPNWNCKARGQRGAGNLRIHCRRDGRYYCTVCQQPFSATAGTVFHRLPYSVEQVTLMLTLLAYGCPVQAIVAAFWIDPRPLAKWLQRAGEHCRRVHAQVVLATPQDLGQPRDPPSGSVQADELRVRMQRRVVWRAMAIAVPTRLWLCGVVSQRRDRELVQALAQQVRACALCRPLLITFDGFRAYSKVFQQAFRSAWPTGQSGRPRQVEWPQIVLGQVVKRYVQRRVTEVERHLIQGSQELLNHLLAHTQGGGLINTAYIERLNASFRASFAPLVWRSRAAARALPTLTAGMYLVGCVYNFCRYHDSLALELALPRGRRWLRRTPAIAGQLTDHGWSVLELLSFKLPPPVWEPPKRQGRPPKAVLEARAAWR